MHQKKIVIGITGAAGFIGSHLSIALINEGYKVVGIDNLSKGSLSNLREINGNPLFSFHKMDVTKFALSKVLKRTNVIVHLAAAKIPRYGDRLSTLLINTKGTENILEIAKKNKAKVIFASTSDVYGKNPKLPFNEESDLVLGSSEVGRWAYAVSKIFDEHLIFAYNEKHNVPFVIIRFFGIYGPRQHRSWWGGPQSVFIDALLANEPIEIHGTGKQKRSFLYIDDAINAIGLIIKSKKAQNQIINVGSHHEVSINELANMIAKMLNRKLRVKKVNYNTFTGKKYEDVQRRVPDIGKAKIILDWTPKYSIKEGLKKTIEWYKNNPA